MGKKTKSKGSKNRRQNGGAAAMKNIKADVVAQEQANDVPSTIVEKPVEGKLRIDSVAEAVGPKEGGASIALDKRERPEIILKNIDEALQIGKPNKELEVSKFKENFDKPITPSNSPEQQPTPTERRESTISARGEFLPESPTDVSMIHPAFRTPSTDSTATGFFASTEATVPSGRNQVTRESLTSLSVPELTITTSTPATSQASSPTPPNIANGPPSPGPRKSKSLEGAGNQYTRRPSQQMYNTSKRRGQIFGTQDSHADDEVHRPINEEFNMIAHNQAQLFGLHNPHRRPQTIHIMQTYEPNSHGMTSDPHLSFQRDLEALDHTLNLNLHQGLRYPDMDEGRQPSTHMQHTETGEAEAARKSRSRTSVPQMTYDGMERARGEKEEQHRRRSERDERGEGHREGSLSKFRSWVGSCLHFGGSH